MHRHLFIRNKHYIFQVMVNLSLILLTVLIGTSIQLKTLSRYHYLLLYILLIFVGCGVALADMYACLLCLFVCLMCRLLRYLPLCLSLIAALIWTAKTLQRHATLKPIQVIMLTLGKYCRMQ